MAIHCSPPITLHVDLKTAQRLQNNHGRRIGKVHASARMRSNAIDSRKCSHHDEEKFLR
jgi:hypothetical protein